MAEQKDEKTIAQEQTSKEFTYHKQLEVAIMDIEKIYTPLDVRVYRTFVYNPPTGYDFTPQIFRSEKNALSSGGLSQGQYDALTPKKKEEYIGERAISVNETKDAAIAAAKKTYKTLLRKFGKEYADEYITKDRGIYVAPLDLKAQWSMISKFKKGHANVIMDQERMPDDIVAIEEIEQYEYDDEGNE